MFSTNKDLMIYLEHYKELIREAEQERMLRKARSAAGRFQNRSTSAKKGLLLILWLVKTLTSRF